MGVSQTLSCLGKEGGRHYLRGSDHSRHSGCFSRAWLNSLGLAGPAWMFLKTPPLLYTLVLCPQAPLWQQVLLGSWWEMNLALLPVLVSWVFPALCLGDPAGSVFWCSLWDCTQGTVPWPGCSIRNRTHLTGWAGGPCPSEEPQVVCQSGHPPPPHLQQGPEALILLCIPGRVSAHILSPCLCSGVSLCPLSSQSVNTFPTWRLIPVLAEPSSWGFKGPDLVTER